MNAILHGREALFTPDATIDPASQAQAYELINNRTFDSAAESQLLQGIALPSQIRGSSPEQVFRQIDDRHSRRILAFMNHLPDDQQGLANISSANLETFLEHYPTPVEFAEPAAEMLERIRLHNPPAKYQDYLQDMANFAHRVYGKRQEYHQAFQNLRAQAAAATRQTMPLTPAEAPTTPDYHEAVASAPELRLLSVAESEICLSSAQLDGDPVLIDGEFYQLQPEFLKGYGLEPKYRFQLENAEFNLSSVYKINNRPAVVAYVKTEHGTKICSYYQSSSQGTWRYLPDYAAPLSPAPGANYTWYGKGYSEESLTLPIAAQAALSVVQSQEPVDLNPNFAKFCFFGTAKHYASTDEYRTALHQGIMRNPMYQEVERMPRFFFGQAASSQSKLPPSALDLAGPLAPDFSQSELPFDGQSTIYGPYHADHFDSQNHQLTWTFNRTPNGEAWIGGIEVKSPISSVGLRTAWVRANDFATPLYDYTKQAAGYGDPNNLNSVDPRYTSMWQNYLRHAPIIQQYLAAQEKMVTKRPPISLL